LAGQYSIPPHLTGVFTRHHADLLTAQWWRDQQIAWESASQIQPRASRAERLSTGSPSI
jgi:hypothetical protein